MSDQLKALEHVLSQTQFECQESKQKLQKFTASSYTQLQEMQDQKITLEKQVARIRHVFACCTGMDNEDPQKMVGNQQDDYIWETLMVQLMKSAVRECINIKSSIVSGLKAGGRRMLFMPHSPGVYVALVLRDAQQIDQELLESNDDVHSNISALLQKPDSALKYLDDDQSDTSSKAPV